MDFFSFFPVTLKVFLHLPCLMRLNWTLVRFPTWCISFGWVRTLQLNSGANHYNQPTPVWRSGLSPVTNKLWYGSCPWSDLDPLNFCGQIQLPYPAALCDMDWERLCKQTASSLPETQSWTGGWPGATTKYSTMSFWFLGNWPYSRQRKSIQTMKCSKCSINGKRRGELPGMISDQ